MSQYSTRVSDADVAARAAIQREAAIDAANLPINSVGVVPLGIRSADTSHASLGYGMAALIATDLAKSRRLVVVERIRLDAVMRELDLTQSGRVDTSSAPRVGRIVGARRMVVGELAIQPGGDMQFGSRVANAASGRVDGTVSGNSTLAQLFAAERTIVIRLFETLGVPLSPDEQRAIEQRPTTTLAAFVEFSRGVRAEMDRDFTLAASRYRAAAQLDPTFTESTDRLQILEGSRVAARNDGSSVDRAANVSVDMINRTTPVIIGTGVDAPAASRDRIITIIITVGTP